MTATRSTPRQEVEREYHATVLLALVRYALDGHALTFETRQQDGHTVVAFCLDSPELAPYMAHLDLAYPASASHFMSKLTEASEALETVKAHERGAPELSRALS